MAELLSKAQAENRVLSAAVDLVLEAMEVDACFLHLYDPVRQRVVLRAASEPYREAIGQVELALGEGVTGWVAAHREPAVIAEDKWSDPRYKYFSVLGGDRYTSMLSVPLISRTDRLVGVVNLHTQERRDFGRSDIGLLRHVASLLAAAIEHAALFEELEAKEEALQRMVKRTVQAQEEERRRVATEIHDGVTQQLISIWRDRPGPSGLRRSERGNLQVVLKPELNQAEGRIQVVYRPRLPPGREPAPDLSYPVDCLP